MKVIGERVMLSAEELVSLIAKGWSVEVQRHNGDRLIRLSRVNGAVSREERLPLDLYEAVFEHAMYLLAETHPHKARVEVGIDFYGNLSGVVRSGLFGLQTAKLKISPRHLAILQRLIHDRSLKEAPA